jgi:prophage regulatory protein
MHTILRLAEVKRRTGFSRSWIYEQIAEGKFPKQIKLGVRGAGWIEADVQAWLQQRIEASRKPAA